MRIAIAGATGLLGRNLLFEIIKQNLGALDQLKIYILGRSLDAYTLEERIKHILLYDGFEYINFKSKPSKEIVNKIFKSIVSLRFDLDEENLSLSDNDIKLLQESDIDCFYHLASYSDFRLTKRTRERLYSTNVEGTKRILNLFNKLSIKKAIYTGTAYSCGQKKNVTPEYSNLNESFRNYYEETKLAAELEFHKYVTVNNINYIIFRPVGICGRLIENPIGKTNKYLDLFYGWGGFFLREKLKVVSSIRDVYSKQIQIPIRIACNTSAGINVVPVDFVAKAILGISESIRHDHYYHIANDKEFSHKTYLSMILNELKIGGYSIVHEEPDDKNDVEQFYYKTVGHIFSPYLSMESINFDIHNLNNILKSLNIRTPIINKDNFAKLIKYAKNNYFGVQSVT